MRVMAPKSSLWPRRVNGSTFEARPAGLCNVLLELFALLTLSSAPPAPRKSLSADVSLATHSSTGCEFNPALLIWHKVAMTGARPRAAGNGLTCHVVTIYGNSVAIGPRTNTRILAPPANRQQLGFSFVGATLLCRANLTTCAVGIPAA